MRWDDDDSFYSKLPATFFGLLRRLIQTQTIRKITWSYKLTSTEDFYSCSQIPSYPYRPIPLPLIPCDYLRKIANNQHDDKISRERTCSKLLLHSRFWHALWVKSFFKTFFPKTIALFSFFEHVQRFLEEKRTQSLFDKFFPIHFSFLNFNNS